ncbi:MAG: hypothetical protein IPJ76_07735 [Flavobacteriales bacterium]|nr:MAG: hypothetical protein IPJ76_07735 [Flavobacteriales bacterium]
MESIPLGKQRYSLSAIAIIALACLLMVSQWRIKGESGHAWERTIRGDAIGYYSYLPALFIHGDLQHDAGATAYINETPQGRVRKYPVGVAVMEVPFFLCADMMVRAQGGLRTGYEKPYHIAIALSGVFSLLIGLVVLRRVLLTWGATDKTIAWVLVLLAGGTSMMYGAAMSSAYSHHWSFMAVACFLRAVQRAFSDRRDKSLVAAVFWLGIIALLRPVNVMVVLAAPLVIAPGASLPGLLRTFRMRTWLMACAVVALVAGLQPLMWWMQCGHWFAWSYGDEGFHWSRPEVLEVLFGPMRGFFFWWPVMLALIPGTVLLWRRSHRGGLLFTGYFVLLIYITSAWWSWYYGDGFGMRPLIDHFPVFALPITAFLGAVGSAWRRVMMGASAILIALHTVQTWQYEKGIIHPHSMSWRKYKAVFLRTGDPWRGALGGNFEMAQYAPHGYDDVFAGELGASTLDAQNPYGQGLAIDSAQLPDRRLFVEAWITRTEPSPGSSREAVVVCEIGNDGAQSFYYSFKLNDLPTPPAAATETWHCAFPMGAPGPRDSLKLYVWLPGEGSVRIDGFKAEVKAVRAGPER